MTINKSIRSRIKSNYDDALESMNCGVMPMMSNIITEEVIHEQLQGKNVFVSTKFDFLKDFAARLDKIKVTDDVIYEEFNFITDSDTLKFLPDHYALVHILLVNGVFNVLCLDSTNRMTTRVLNEHVDKRWVGRTNQNLLFEIFNEQKIECKIHAVVYYDELDKGTIRQPQNADSGCQIFSLYFAKVIQSKGPALYSNFKKMATYHGRITDDDKHVYKGIYHLNWLQFISACGREFARPIQSVTTLSKYDMLNKADISVVNGKEINMFILHCGLEYIKSVPHLSDNIDHLDQLLISSNDNFLCLCDNVQLYLADQTRSNLHDMISKVLVDMTHPISRDEWSNMLLNAGPIISGIIKNRLGHLITVDNFLSLMRKDIAMLFQDPAKYPHLNVLLKGFKNGLMSIENYTDMRICPLLFKSESQTERFIKNYQNCLSNSIYDRLSVLFTLSDRNNFYLFMYVMSLGQGYDLNWFSSRIKASQTDPIKLMSALIREVSGSDKYTKLMQVSASQTARELMKYVRNLIKDLPMYCGEKNMRIKRLIVSTICQKNSYIGKQLYKLIREIRHKHTHLNTIYDSVNAKMIFLKAADQLVAKNAIKKLGLSDQDLAKCGCLDKDCSSPRNKASNRYSLFSNGSESQNQCVLAHIVSTS